MSDFLVGGNCKYLIKVGDKAEKNLSTDTHIYITSLIPKKWKLSHCRVSGKFSAKTRDMRTIERHIKTYNHYEKDFESKYILIGCGGLLGCTET